MVVNSLDYRVGDEVITIVVVGIVDAVANDVLFYCGDNIVVSLQSTTIGNEEAFAIT